MVVLGWLIFKRGWIISIANVQWRMEFPNAGVKHYTVNNSNHVLLILNLSGGEVSMAKYFKFEKF